VDDVGDDRSSSQIDSAARLDVAIALTQLEQKNLSTQEIEAIGKRKELLREYRVKRALAFHPHVPRTLALRLVRELYTMDLMRLAQSPTAAGDLQNVAEQALIVRLSQLALGEKISLARQASARTVGALLVEGHRKVAGPALDNPRLTEAQVLKVLSKEKIAPAVVTAVCHHAKWTTLPTVRMALTRHRQTPLDASIKFLRLMTDAELMTLSEIRTLSSVLRAHLEQEIEKRKSRRGGSG
jgi:hypothetical protein